MEQGGEMEIWRSKKADAPLGPLGDDRKHLEHWHTASVYRPPCPRHGPAPPHPPPPTPPPPPPPPPLRGFPLIGPVTANMRRGPG